MADEEDVDAEALQAQIDASLAQTAALVESWLKPPPVASASASASEQLTMADFQASLRRPARLGVGAALPDAGMGPARQETARLRGRLVGGKRGRDSGEAETHMVQRPSDDDDDVEESRASAIKKKARVDPFAGSTKSKGKAKQDFPKASPVTALMIPPTEDSSPSQVSLIPPLATTEAETTGAEPKKKRKKKRKAAAILNSKDNADTLPESNGRFVRAPRSLSSTPEASLPTAQSASGSPSRQQDLSPSPTPVPTSPRASTASVLESSRSTPAFSSPALPTSLLNLDGPPPEAEQADDSPAKKRRRKKRKSKQTTDVPFTT